MSAILGCVNTDNTPIDMDILNVLCSAVEYRAPDGVFTWTQANVALGIGRLCVTPEDIRETQPLVGNNCVLVADIRLDNRSELISKLGLVIKPEPTDAELLLRAYTRWGIDCVKHLLGDFAFALWDITEKRLFCARDSLGLRPFYYATSDDKFVFASTLSAFRSVRAISRDIDEIQIGLFILGDFHDTTRTIYKAIRRLPPAYFLVLEHNREPVVTSYWELDPTRTLTGLSDEQYEAEFRDLFVDAVRCRLRSAYPIGAELSGGLDSSSVVCTARALTSDPIRTYSAVFPNAPKSDERTFIDAVLSGGGLVPSFLNGDELDPCSTLQRLQDWSGDLIQAGNIRIAFKARELAHQDQVRVILNGLDGDTIISHGFHYLQELAVDNRWRDFVQESNALWIGPSTNAAKKMFDLYGAPVIDGYVNSRRIYPLTTALLNVHKEIGISWKSLALRYILRPLVPQSILTLRRHLLHVEQSASAYDMSYLNPGYAQRANLTSFRSANRVYDRNWVRTVHENHYAVLMTRSNLVAAEITEELSSPFHIETRSPFLDRRLVEYALALPTSQKIRHGWTRWILRRALKPYLPPAIAERRDKANLQQSFTDVFNRFAQETLEEMFQDKQNPIFDYLNFTALATAFERAKNENSSGNYEIPLLNALALRFWIAKNEIE